MYKRVSLSMASLVAGVLLTATTVQAQQSVVFNVGYFAARGEATRVTDDVLVENLSLFAFDIKDFNGAAVGGEWVIGIGDYFDAGVGIGFYQRTVPSVYLDFVDDDGTEIFQDFRLRIVPVTATIRVLPFGRHTAIQPYFGAGVGVFNWQYSEVGEFIDFNNFDIFRDRFVADGTDVGGLLLGGVRIPFTDRYSAGVELRYQSATGRVRIDQGFLNERIDLGGLTTQFTFQVGF